MIVKLPTLFGAGQKAVTSVARNRRQGNACPDAGPGRAIVQAEDLMTDDRAIDLFVENAGKAGAQVVRVNSADELDAVLAAMLEGATSVYSPGVTPTNRQRAIPPDRRTDDYVNVSACVEEVSAAVVETGSLVCSSQGGKPVQAGLLPGHHIAIVAAENVYEDLDQFFAALGTPRRPTSRWKPAPAELQTSS